MAGNLRYRTADLRRSRRVCSDRNESGEGLSIYTNVDRLEAELFRRSPQDAVAIRDFTHSIRALGKFRMLDPSGGLAGNWLNMLRDLPVFPLLAKLSKLSGREYGNRFSDPLLKAFFSNGDIGKMSAIAMIISLAWMNAGNAGYCIGGSQALIRLIEEKIAELGGRSGSKPGWSASWWRTTQR